MSNLFNNFLTKVKNNFIYLLLIFSVILVFGIVGTYKFTKTTYKVTIPVSPINKFNLNNNEIQLELFYKNNFFYSLDYTIDKQNINHLEISSVKKRLLIDVLNDYDAIDNLASFFNTESRFQYFLKNVNRPNYLSETLRQMKLSRQEELYNIQNLRYNSEEQNAFVLLIDDDMTALELQRATALIVNNINDKISSVNRIDYNDILYNSILVLESVTREMKANHESITQKEIEKKLELYYKYQLAESYAKVLGLDTQNITTEETATVIQKSSIPLDTILGLKNLRNILDKIQIEINDLKSNKSVKSDIFVTKLEYNDNIIESYRDLIANQVDLINLGLFDYNMQEIVIEKYRRENDLLIISLILALSLSIVFLIVRKD